MSDTTVKQIQEELSELLESSGGGRVSANFGMKNGNKLFLTLVTKDEVEEFEEWIEKYDTPN